jgi:hypothetical protein
MAGQVPVPPAIFARTETVPYVKEREVIWTAPERYPQESPGSDPTCASSSSKPPVTVTFCGEKHSCSLLLWSPGPRGAVQADESVDPSNSSSNVVGGGAVVVVVVVGGTVVVVVGGTVVVVVGGTVVVVVGGTVVVVVGGTVVVVVVVVAGAVVVVVGGGE